MYCFHLYTRYLALFVFVHELFHRESKRTKHWITFLSHCMLVKCMLLAKDWLPNHDDLVTIQNLPLVLGWITLLTKCMASEDLGYTILHHVNSLANNLIGLTIPHPASAPAPGLAILTLPPRVEFPTSHVWDKPLDVPHPDSYDALLEPLVHPTGINWDVNLSTLTWSTGTYHNVPYSYAKDGPNHKPRFIGVNFAGCLSIASSKHVLGQLLHRGDRLWNHEEHDSWKEGPVTTLGHNTSHSLSRCTVSFLFFFFTWLHHQSADGIATDMSLLCFLPVLLFLLLWSLCYSPTKLLYINHYDMFVVL